MGKQQQCNVGSASGWITYEATTGKQRDGPSTLGALLNGSYLKYSTNVTFTQSIVRKWTLVTIMIS